MTFLESPRLDSRITQGAKSTRQWKRIKVYTANGRLSQDFRWAYPKHQMDVSHGLRSRDDYLRLMDFFHVINGNQFAGFRVKDWTDFRLTVGNSRLQNISGTQWQICRLHDIGTAFFLRPVFKPVVDSVIVFRARAGTVGVASATVDYTTGIATITDHADGDTYTCSGEFDIPMTFQDDEWEGDLMVNTENLWVQSQSIVLEELRL